MWACVPWCTHAKVRGQLSGVISLLPQEDLGSNSKGHQAGVASSITHPDFQPLIKDFFDFLVMLSETTLERA